MSEPIRSYYAIIPASVRYDQRLKPNAKLLYGEITALCNEKGFCWATNDYFSELYGVSKTSISKWISNLVSCGYLSMNIEYKENTKQILKRYLTIVQYPIEEKFNTPIEEKFKDNNTVINTTINNNIMSVVDYYKENCKSLPQPRTITEQRKKHIKARLEDYGYEEVIKALDIAERSEFLAKGPDKGWLSFDWIFNPNNFVKIVEGKFGARQKKPEPKKNFFGEIDTVGDVWARFD